MEMEELHAAALASYSNGSPELQRLAWSFFQSMDTNNDGQISSSEFYEFLHQSGYSWIINDPSFFMKLDQNCDGGLDFYKVLTLYYIVKTRNILCQGCRVYLCGLYFTCVACFDVGADHHQGTYDLCAACYRIRNFYHHHTYFFGSHALLDCLLSLAVYLAMEELRAAADAYYTRGNEHTQRVAYDFFRSMDTDGDGRISYAEFNGFVQQSGYNGILHNDPDLFAKLDRNRDSHLDFKEVLTFYYIIKTRYITCQGCRAHLCGLYFTCVECFDGGAANYYYHPQYPTYDLCAACYRSTNYTHQHPYFLDNHVLLSSKRGPPHARPTLAMAVAPQNPLVIYVNNPPEPEIQRNRWYESFVALEIALSISALATNCTIM
ncbi:hypothetical protein ACE6H2_000464 [Prunus campanulata]